MVCARNAHNTVGLKTDMPHGHVTLRFRSVQAVATITSKENRQTASVHLEKKICPMVGLEPTTFGL